MLELYNTEGTATRITHEIVDHVWVKLSSPTMDEVDEVAGTLGIDPDDLMAAADPEEKTRVEMQDDYTLILVDVPATEGEERARNTIPLGIILTQNNVVTVCSEDTPFLSDFHAGHVRGFATKNHVRFVCQILLRNALLYQQVLADIDRKRIAFERNIDNITHEHDLVSLHSLESSLVYLSTSLRGNANVLTRLQRLLRFRSHERGMDILDDAVVENQQAIEMAQIYREVIDGTRDLLSSVMDLRLNDTMQRLTYITIIMEIPAIVGGFWGMNVDLEYMPLALEPYGFGIIVAGTALVCAVALLWMRRKRML